MLADNGATSKIDNVLTEHVGRLHILPLTVHLKFFFLDRQVGGTILGKFYSLGFVVGPLIHA